MIMLSAAAEVFAGPAAVDPGPSAPCRAEEQRGGGFPRGFPAGEQQCDLEFLRCQVVDARPVTLPVRFTRGREFRPGHGRPRAGRRVGRSRPSPCATARGRAPCSGTGEAAARTPVAYAARRRTNRLRRPTTDAVSLTAGPAPQGVEWSGPGQTVGAARVLRGVGWTLRPRPDTGAAATTTPGPPGQAYGQQRRRGSRR